MSEKLTKIVVDCATGKQTILPLTLAEIAQRDQDAAAAAEAQAAREAEEIAMQEMKNSIKAKLIAGETLTAEEVDFLL